MSDIEGPLQHLRDQFTEFIEVREAKEIATKEADRLKKEYKALEEQLWEALESSGLSSLKLEINGEKIQFVAKERLVGNVFDKDAAEEYLKNAGLWDQLTDPQKFIQARINELVKEALEHGQPLPDGVDYHGVKTISVTRPK